MEGERGGALTLEEEGEEMRGEAEGEGVTLGCLVAGGGDVVNAA